MDTITDVLFSRFCNFKKKELTLSKEEQQSPEYLHFSSWFDNLKKKTLSEGVRVSDFYTFSQSFISYFPSISKNFYLSELAALTGYLALIEKNKEKTSWVFFKKQESTLIKLPLNQRQSAGKTEVKKTSEKIYSLEEMSEYQILGDQAQDILGASGSFHYSQVSQKGTKRKRKQ